MHLEGQQTRPVPWHHSRLSDKHLVLQYVCLEDDIQWDAALSIVLCWKKQSHSWESVRHFGFRGRLNEKCSPPKASSKYFWVTVVHCPSRSRLLELPGKTRYSERIILTILVSSFFTLIKFFHQSPGISWAPIRILTLDRIEHLGASRSVPRIEVPNEMKKSETHMGVQLLL